MAYNFDDRRYQKGYRPDLNYEKTRKQAPQINPGSLPGSLPPDERALLDKGKGRSLSYNQYNFAIQAGETVQIAPTNNVRSYLLLQNNSPSPIFIGFGIEPDANTGLLLPANGYFEPYFPPNNAIFGFSSNDTLGVILDGILNKI